MVNIKLNIILWKRHVNLSSQNINAKLSIRKLGSSSVLIIIIIIINISRIILVFYCKCCNLIGYSTSLLAIYSSIDSE